MATKEENKFREKVQKILESWDMYYEKNWGGGLYTRDGTPDLSICWNGLWVSIELKWGKGQPSDIQKAKLTHINRSRGIGVVIRNMDEFNDFTKLMNEEEYDIALDRYGIEELPKVHSGTAIDF